MLHVANQLAILQNSFLSWHPALSEHLIHYWPHNIMTLDPTDDTFICYKCIIDSRYVTTSINPKLIPTSASVALNSFLGHKPLDCQDDGVGGQSWAFEWSLRQYSPLQGDAPTPAIRRGFGVCELKEVGGGDKQERRSLNK